ncbi:MAG: hypothetical protein JKY46_07020 [Robiginitomaculum sp.]|nr:hypothetical protein [Robiginitomaculum sp.]
MIIRLFVCLVFLSLPTLVQAQAVSWDELNAQAYKATQNDDNEQAIILLKQALEQSASDRQINATHLGFVMAYENLKKWELVIKHADIILTSSEMNSPIESERKVYLLKMKRKAFVNLDRWDEAKEMAGLLGDLERNQPKAGIVFDEDRTAIHQFTGFKCPQNIADMQFDDVTSYNSIGSNVSCKYSLPVIGKVDVFMTRYGNSGQVDMQAAVASTKDSIDRAYNNPKWYHEGSYTLSVGGESIAVWEGVAEGSNVEEGLHRTGYWQTVYGDWIYKVRISWALPLTLEEVRQEVVPALFSANVADMWVKQCTAVSDNIAEVIEIKEEDDRFGSEATNALVGVSLFALEKHAKGNADEKEAAKDFIEEAKLLNQAKGAGCLLAAIGDKTSRDVVWTPLEYDLISHFSAPLPITDETKLIFSMRIGFDPKITQPALFAQQGDITYLVKLFDGKLSDQQFLQELKNIRQNGFPYRGSVDASSNNIILPTSESSKD